MMRVRLGDCLQEITRGIGSARPQYRLVGTAREGLAPAKERIGKSPERYKLVEPGTIFYNPMRILLGSIAFIGEGQEPGITSPDYVVFKTRPEMIHPRWFYHWLRSDHGAGFIRTLARGAVRERMLFRRVAAAEIEVPAIESQIKFAQAMAPLKGARAAVEAQLRAAMELPVCCLRKKFSNDRTGTWPMKRLGETCKLLPSKSIASNGDTVIRAITTACLSEVGFRPEGIKTARMWAGDAKEPEELLDIIEAKGREVADAIAALRKMVV
jgi:hypothetical protein